MKFWEYYQLMFRKKCEVESFFYVDINNFPPYIFLIPLQSGYPLQLQNSFPALRPLLATRLSIGLPHFGHFGASALMLCAVR